ncbi:unnamed protein product [Paramecium octaurelia]|uniref:Uncharacterized protein n=1 Tax=Paramecium octaurelia TaxID=43137 RepID=A0A8S1WQX6_PAROT|nr:unnamed protein product [Paramecium octaurelia]
MYKPQMIEKEKDFNCSMKHQLPITMVVLDHKFEINNRFLCHQCLEYFESDVKMVGFKKLIQTIEDNKKKQLEHLENMIAPIITKVQSIQGHITNLKSFLVLQLDQVMDNTKDWISNLQSLGLKHSHYSLYEELDVMILNQRSIENDQIIQVNQIKQLNDSMSTKFNNKLDSFKQFKEYQKFQLLLLEISSQLEQNINLYQIINEKQQNKNQVCDRISQQLSPCGLQLINDSVKQAEICYGIVFDPTGKIMVSTSEKNIKIWSFENGNVKLTHTLQGHSDIVKCLVFSQIEYYFISGSCDQSIRMWKSLNNEWQSSQPYYQHKKEVNCIILTQKEDQLISGSNDKTILVWKIHYKDNKLQFLYSLENHNGSVYSLSLNESERVLASSQYNQIMIWLKQSNNQWMFKQVVNLSEEEGGYHVKFLNDAQFIWLQQNGNNLSVFEIVDGLYQKNKQKRVQLKKVELKKFYQGYTNINMPFFPIIHIQAKSLICLRYLLEIYIIKVQIDGKLSIINQLNCNHWQIYGTITNDGQYLAFWCKEGYQIHEILYK